MCCTPTKHSTFHCRYGTNQMQITNNKIIILQKTYLIIFQEMATWSLKLSKDLVRIKGRQLPPESIFQGHNAKYLAGDTTEGWTRDMR